MSGVTGVDRSYFWGGGFAPLSEREINIEFAAGALQQRASSDIAREGEIIDAHLLKGMPYGWNRSDPDKPVLEFPFMTLREAREWGEGGNKEESEIVNQLTALLPQEVKEKLKEELKKPPNQRNASYAALDRALGYAAKMWATLQFSARPLESSPASLASAQKNLEFTEVALAHLIDQARELLQEGYAALKKMGPNHPHFDLLLKHLKSAAGALRLLKRLLDEEEAKKRGGQEKGKEEKRERKKGEKERKQEALESLIGQVELSGRQYDAAFAGGGLLMIGPLFHAMGSIGRTQSLEAGLRSLLFGLLLYGIGMGEEPSAASPIGRGISRVINRLVEIAAEAALNEEDPRGYVLFPRLAKAFIVAFVSGSLYVIVENEHPAFIEESFLEKGPLSEAEARVVNVYTLLDLLQLFLHSGLLEKALPQEMLASHYAGENSLNITVELLEFTLLSIIARSVKQIDGEAGDLLLSGLVEALIIRTKSLEEAASRSQSGGEEGNPLLAALTSSRIALEREQYGEWCRFWDQIAVSLGVDEGAVEDEIERLCSHARLLQQLFAADLRDYAHASTGIVQI